MNPPFSMYLTPPCYLATFDWQAVVGVCSILGVLVGIAGFYFVYHELKLSRIRYRQESAAGFYAITSQFYRMLVDKPDLRKYFYDAEIPCPDDEKTKQTLFAMCEYIADILELIVDENSPLDKDLRESWEDYGVMLAKSQSFRRYIQDHGIVYTEPFLQKIFGRVGA